MERANLRPNAVEEALNSAVWLKGPVVFVRPLPALWFDRPYQGVCVCQVANVAAETPGVLIAVALHRDGVWYLDLPSMVAACRARSGAASQ
jgi:hypothetical protein